jgi:predicted RNA-binding protein
VYVEADGGLEKLMDEVIRIDVENGKLRLTDLLGKEKYVQGKLRSIDFWEEHSVIVEPSR